MRSPKSTNTSPEDRYRRTPRCRTCKHRQHPGRKCNAFSCACGDVATVPDAYPFELPDADRPPQLVLLNRRDDTEDLVYSVAMRRPHHPDGPAILSLTLKQNQRLQWFAVADSGPIGFGRIFAEAQSPDRALATLSRMLGKGLDFRARVLEP